MTRLRRQGTFTYCRDVSYQRQPAQQYVAEAAVVLPRPAWRQRRRDGRWQRVKVPGRPLPVRLVVSEVRSARGVVLVRWLLLSNVPAEGGRKVIHPARNLPRSKRRGEWPGRHYPWPSPPPSMHQGCTDRPR